MIFEKLKSIAAEVLDIEPEKINLSSDFQTDLGADSLDLAQIIMEAEDEFGVELPPDEMENLKTVKDAVDKLKALTGKED